MLKRILYSVVDPTLCFLHFTWFNIASVLNIFSLLFFSFQASSQQIIEGKDVELKITECQLEEKSKIFNPKSRPLTKYESAVNEASKELCMQDATLLTNRNELLQKARKTG